MGAFEWLPTVESCCFSIPLKIGAIIVAVLSLIFSLGQAGNLEMEQICSINQPSRDAVSIVKYVVQASAVCTIFASIGFIIGIILDKAITATIYLYVMLVSFIAFIIYFILAVVLPLTSDFCSIKVMLLTSIAITTLIKMYFMVIAKSYREEMS